jgi:hypothetical protein
MKNDVVLRNFGKYVPDDTADVNFRNTAENT